MFTAEEMIQGWYNKAQVDYVQKYMALYAAFNAWYRQETRTTNDRQALNMLCRRTNAIWQEYCEGRTLFTLAAPMGLLVELTQREPVSYATPH